MRIAVSSSTFRRPLANGELTQLEWLERCASVLGVDGVLAAVADFPRTDDEYVAQLRKIAVDLGVVPFGIDAGSLFATTDGDDVRAAALALATRFGAAIVRTVLPAPGDVPPATFVEGVRVAKAFAREAKRVNVTAVVATAPGTIGADAAGVKHFVKDVDSAWLRACPSALSEPAAKERVPALCASAGDPAADVAAHAARAWVILGVAEDAVSWHALTDAVAELRRADAERLLARA